MHGDPMARARGTRSAQDPVLAQNPPAAHADPLSQVPSPSRLPTPPHMGKLAHPPAESHPRNTRYPSRPGAGSIGGRAGRRALAVTGAGGRRTRGDLGTALDLEYKKHLWR